MTSEDTNSAISSPESAGGPSPLHGPDGEGQSGPAAVPVSRFRAQESGKAMPTNATSGPLFNNSSPSATLQWSLESRLRQRMEGSGCPLYELTWSQWDMPAGPQICRQRASASTIAEADSFGLHPTPMANDAKGSHSPISPRAAQPPFTPVEANRLVQDALGVSTPTGKFGALHDGLPGRLGQLRAYGNAIVPQVAAEFVRAFMERQGLDTNDHNA